MSVAGSANADVPIGVILPYGGFIAPKNGWWLLCDGSVYNPVEYPALYDTIGTIFGGTANAPLLPDMRGKYGLGYTAGVNSVGETIPPTLSGTQTFTLKASDIPSLSPFDSLPSYKVSITDTIYRSQAQTTRASNIVTGVEVESIPILDSPYIKYDTTITGGKITYTNASPSPVTNNISATSVAYSGYDMTYIIKAKGF